MRVLAEAVEQVMDGGLREKLLDQTDESQQILLERRWKEAHQWLTRINEKAAVRREVFSFFKRASQIPVFHMYSIHIFCTFSPTFLMTWTGLAKPQYFIPQIPNVNSNYDDSSLLIYSHL